MGKKIQIGVGGAPFGAGTAFDPERVIDPKHVLVCITISKVALKNRQKIETDHAESLLGSIDEEITYCG